MLGALLFAGALHVDLADLAKQRAIIGVLAVLGVLVSTAVVGTGTFFVCAAIGIDIPFIHCLLFGALISPTDPIAVMSVLKRISVPHTLKIKIAGESLFNDGVGVVVFLTLLRLTAGQHEVSVSEVADVLVREVLGGLVFGFGVGWIAYHMLKRIDQHQIEVLITLAVVTGGYALALELNLSGPLAMVVAGLLIGNHGRRFAMSDRTRERLDVFWELVDDLLNALLFMLIGFELLVVTIAGRTVFAGLLCIPIVLGARWISVALPITVMRFRRTFSPHVIKLLTWSGLRGGISVALALTLAAAESRAIILPITYTVVAFSILVQGLTLRPMVLRLYGIRS
jgi:CPA1 family monovalent cation:H+ antiporter